MEEEDWGGRGRAAPSPGERRSARLRGQPAPAAGGGGAAPRGRRRVVVITPPSAGPSAPRRRRRRSVACAESSSRKTRTTNDGVGRRGRVESDDTRGAGATEHVGMAGAWVGRPVEKRDRTSREGIDAREREDGQVGAEPQAARGGERVGSALPLLALRSNQRNHTQTHTHKSGGGAPAHTHTQNIIIENPLGLSRAGDS